jgi:hypothetical protein
MAERYQPQSEFLRAVVAEQCRLSGDEFADANLRLLIEMMRDQDPSNRDWATFLLAQQDLDGSEIRDALLEATSDSFENVRAEAIWGLARRDPELALPFVRSALSADTAQMPVFEAAILCADPSLIGDLREWTEPSENSFLDKIALDALTACEEAASQRRTDA